MTDINLNPGEVSRVRLHLLRIQQGARSCGNKGIFIYNQARQLLLLVQKAERREARARQKSTQP